MGNNHFVINKDTLKESKELSFASELAREKVFDPRAIEIVSVEQTSSIFSHICLVPLFDLHSASVGANAVREEKAVQFIAGTANAFCDFFAVNRALPAVQRIAHFKYADFRHPFPVPGQFVSRKDSAGAGADDHHIVIHGGGTPSFVLRVIRPHSFPEKQIYTFRNV